MSVKDKKETKAKSNAAIEIMTAAEIRSWLAEHKISKVELSEATGIEYNYLVQILNDMRVGTAKRKEITEYLRGDKAA